MKKYYLYLHGYIRQPRSYVIADNRSEAYEKLRYEYPISHYLYTLKTK